MNPKESALLGHIFQYEQEMRTDIFREPFSELIVRLPWEETGIITTTELSILTWSNQRGNYHRELAKRFLPSGTFIHPDNILHIKEGEIIALKMAGDTTRNPFITGYIYPHFDRGPKFNQVTFYPKLQTYY